MPFSIRFESTVRNSKYNYSLRVATNCFIQDTATVKKVKSKNALLAIPTVGGQMSGTAGQMFFCRKGKPLTIS